jgi:hypothetical protein
MLALLWAERPELLTEFGISFGNWGPRGLGPDRRSKPRDPAIDKRLEALCPQVLEYCRDRVG